MFAPIPYPPLNATDAETAEYRRALRQRRRSENIYAALTLGFLAIGGLAAFAIPIVSILL